MSANDWDARARQRAAETAAKHQHSAASYAATARYEVHMASLCDETGDNWCAAWHRRAAKEAQALAAACHGQASNWRDLWPI